MVWLVVAGCHGSPARARQPAPPASTKLQPPVIDASWDNGSMTPLDTVPPDATTPVDAALRATHERLSRIGAADVVFHVINDTGVDVFINDDYPLMLEQRGKPVELYHGCGSDCPSCACADCPYKPLRFRRIPDRHTWVYGWGRRVYVDRRCGPTCPCIREIAAKPGTYTVTLQGKGGANAPPTGSPLFYDAHPNERHVDCQATATFDLKPAAHVDLKLTCQR